MKVLVLIGLVAFAFALNENIPKQGGLFDDDTSSQLRHSRLGRTILQLAELASLSQQFDFSQLFDAIDEVEASIKDGQSDENKSFETDYESYVADLQYYSNQVTQYKGEVATHEQDLEGLEQQLDYLSDYLQEKVEQLSDTQKLSSDLGRLMKSLEIGFNAQVNDYNSAISVLDQVLTILEQLEAEPELIQKHRQSLAQLSDQFKQQFSTMSKHRIMYQPLALALVSLTSQDYADQNLVRKVTKLLEGLRAQLASGLLSVQNAYESSRQSNQEIQDQYTSLADSLTNVVIPGLEDDIETTNSDIKTKKVLLSDAQNNKAAAEDNSKFTEDNWVKRQVSHKNLIDEYNSELAVIGQALTALERGGIRRN